jgi:hypothetical protein
MKHAALISLICTVLAVLSADVMASGALRYNPFEQPVPSNLVQTDAKKTTGKAMELRGTIIDGHNSMVNINGKLYRVNQKVAGYRIVRIGSASVTLRRGSNKMVLTLKDDK